MSRYKKTSIFDTIPNTALRRITSYLPKENLARFARVSKTTSLFARAETQNRNRQYLSRSLPNFVNNQLEFLGEAVKLGFRTAKLVAAKKPALPKGWKKLGWSKEYTIMGPNNEWELRNGEFISSIKKRIIGYRGDAGGFHNMVTARVTRTDSGVEILLRPSHLVRPENYVQDPRNPRNRPTQHTIGFNPLAPRVGPEFRVFITISVGPKGRMQANINIDFDEAPETKSDFYRILLQRYYTAIERVILAELTGLPITYATPRIQHRFLRHQL